MPVDIERAARGLCVVCGKPKRFNALTCSNEDCHETFVTWCENQHGLYKKVSGPDGVVRRVPTRDIVEKGLKASELENYPAWGLEERK